MHLVTGLRTKPPAEVPCRLATPAAPRGRPTVSNFANPLEGRSGTTKAGQGSRGRVGARSVQRTEATLPHVVFSTIGGEASARRPRSRFSGGEVSPRRRCDQ